MTEKKYRVNKYGWEELLKKFNYSCAYCGKTPKIETLHKEHILPLSKGGIFKPNNIIPACSSCNISKGVKPFSNWYPKQDFYSKERELFILKEIIEDVNYNDSTVDWIGHEQLKEFRIKANLTQAQISKMIGVSVNAYRNWEQGTSEPKEENLEKLKEVLDFKEDK